MWLAVLLGLCMGTVLNIGADRLPRSSLAKPHGRHRVARWSILLVMSTAFCAYLQRRYGWSVTFATQATYCSLLLLIAVIDLEHSLVPNVLVGSGMALAVGVNILWSAPGLSPALWGSAIAGGIFVLLALARRNALGLGDVKLAFLIGMITGFPWVLQALTLGILLGGVAAGLFLLTRVRRPKEYMPYAPYLAAGGIVTLLRGQEIAHWFGSLIRSGG
jgi:prepilin signal peptidase PulO-like enzyme (type II secretory pathway)